MLWRVIRTVDLVDQHGLGELVPLFQQLLIAVVMQPDQLVPDSPQSIRSDKPSGAPA